MARLSAASHATATTGPTASRPSLMPLRDLPLIERKWRLFKLIGKSKRAIRYNEHLTSDGPLIFDHVCRMGLEGIVSKRVDSPYRSGLSKLWLKSINPASEPVRREREEEWR